MINFQSRFVNSKPSGTGILWGCMGGRTFGNKPTAFWGVARLPMDNERRRGYS